MACLLFLASCPRESNEVAHVLASKADGYLITLWQGDPLDFIIDVHANDVSLFEIQ